MGYMPCRVCAELRKVGAWGFGDDPAERVHECSKCGDPEYFDESEVVPPIPEDAEDDYNAWRRRNEAPTVYSDPTPPGEVVPPIPEKWFIGKSRQFKMIHRENCRYAKHEYLWAGTCTVEQFIAALGQARVWHRGCVVCAPDLNRLLGGRSHALMSDSDG